LAIGPRKKSLDFVDNPDRVTLRLEQALLVTTARDTHSYHCSTYLSAQPDLC